ncbi:MAG: glycosyltransferase family 9 protein, partial [Crocinitomicaceae bacterium]
LPKNVLLFDSTGKLTLQELITMIGGANGLVACSTGPLHIAGILDRKAIGIFSPRKPIHPGRWQPLGNESKALVFDQECPNCKKGEDCGCLEDISVKTVLSELL